MGFTTFGEFFTEEDVPDTVTGLAGTIQDGITECDVEYWQGAGGLGGTTAYYQVRGILGEMGFSGSNTGTGGPAGTYTSVRTRLDAMGGIGGSGYLPRDGTLPMTGDLDLDDYDLIFSTTNKLANEDAGNIRFKALDADDNVTQYMHFYATIASPTAGSETGRMRLDGLELNVNRTVMDWNLFDATWITHLPLTPDQDASYSIGASDKQFFRGWFSDSVRVANSSGGLGIGITPTVDLHIDAPSPEFRIADSAQNVTKITSYSNRTLAAQDMLLIEGYWNSTKVSEIAFETGSDTANKDDGVITFSTSPNSATGVVERLSIDVDGVIRFNNAFSFPTSDGTANYILETNGSGTISWVVKSSGVVDGSGTASYIPKWSDSDTLTDSVMYDDGTNIGIGTTSPAALLEIETSSATKALLIDQNNNQRSLDIAHDGTSQHCANIDASSLTTGNALRVASNSSVAVQSGTEGFVSFTLDHTGSSKDLFTLDNDGTGQTMRVYDGVTEVFTIADGGNVGINDSSPSYELDVDGDIRTMGAMRFSDGSSMTTASTGSATSVSNNNNVVITADADNNGSGEIQLQINGTTHSVLTNAGDVGIGTTSPDDLLHIFEGDSTATPNSDANLIVESAGTSYIEIMTGTASAGGILFTDSGASGRGNVLYNHNGDYMAFQTAGSERIRIESGGDVGIGTTNPTDKLHVVGSGVADVLLRLESTQTGAFGPNLVLWHNSSSPAASDICGVIVFQGEDSGGVATNYGEIRTAIESPTAGAERGRMSFWLFENSTNVEYLRLNGSGAGEVIVGNTANGSTLVVSGDLDPFTDNGAAIGSTTKRWSILTFAADSGIDWYDSGAVLEASIRGTSSGYVTVNTTGNRTGFEVTPGAYVIDVNGVAHASSHSNSSDIRFKENIITIPDPLDKIKRMRGVFFDWKNDYGPKVNDPTQFLGRELGFIAQEVRDILPEVISLWEPTDPDSFLSLEYARITALLVEGVKEHATITESNTERIEKLEAEIEILKAA